MQCRVYLLGFEEQIFPFPKKLASDIFHAKKDDKVGKKLLINKKGKTSYV